MPNLTLLLDAAACGDPQAAANLLPLVYDELRRLADAQISAEKPGQTLQATALVHEAYLRLVKPSGDHEAWNGRGHFFGAAARAMRQILVDAARRKSAEKRGGDRLRLTFTAAHEVMAPAEPSADELLDLDAALSRLAALDPTKAKLVELRYFAGLTEAEAAAALGISLATAGRYWLYARSWLFGELHPE